MMTKLEVVPAVCPACKGTLVQRFEETREREVLGITSTGTVIIDDSDDTSVGGIENPRIWCVACETELDLPNEYSSSVTEYETVTPVEAFSDPLQALAESL